MNMRILLFSILLAAPAAVVQAAPPATAAPAGAAAGDARIDATFAAWDTNKDHQLSLAEFKAGWAALQQAAAAQGAL